MLNISILPIELQQRIWMIYKTKYVLEELKLIHSNRLSDYELVYDESITLVKDIVSEMSTMHTLQPLHFALAVDATIDRIITDEWYCFDSTKQMHILAEMILKGIHHPSLLIIDLNDIYSRDGNVIRNKIDNLTSIQRMITRDAL